MCAGSVQPNICHSPGGSMNYKSFFQPSRIAAPFQNAQTQTASVWTYGAEEFVHWLFNLSHGSVTTPERVEMPTVSNRVGRTNCTPKTPWCAGTLRTSFSETFLSMHVSASYRWHQETNRINAAHLKIQMSCSILTFSLQIHCYLKCSLLPFQLQFPNIFF